MRASRFLRAVNILLAVVAICGAVFAWQAYPEYRKADREYRRLVRKVGRFEVDDESRFHVQAVPTEDPQEWLWNVYLPPKTNARLATRSSSGGGSTGKTTDSGKYGRIRLRIQEDAEGEWSIWHDGVFGTGFSSIHNRDDFDPESWRVTANPDETDSFGTDEAFELIAIESHRKRGLRFRMVIGGYAAVDELLQRED